MSFQTSLHLFILQNTNSYFGLEMMTEYYFLSEP